MAEPHEVFAANLRRTRERMGISQEELASRCGLHRTEISFLERAQREPRLSTIVKLSKALDVSAGDLLKGL